MRRAIIDRRTRETQIAVNLDLDGKGKYDVKTGIRFLDHMLELIVHNTYKMGKTKDHLHHQHTHVLVQAAIPISNVDPYL